MNGREGGGFADRRSSRTSQFNLRTKAGFVQSSSSQPLLKRTAVGNILCLSSKHRARRSARATDHGWRQSACTFDHLGVRGQPNPGISTNEMTPTGAAWRPAVQEIHHGSTDPAYVTDTEPWNTLEHREMYTMTHSMNPGTMHDIDSLRTTHSRIGRRPVWPEPFDPEELSDGFRGQFAGAAGDAASKFISRHRFREVIAAVGAPIHAAAYGAEAARSPFRRRGRPPRYRPPVERSAYQYVCPSPRRSDSRGNADDDSNSCSGGHEEQLQPHVSPRRRECSHLRPRGQPDDAEPTTRTAAARDHDTARHTGHDHFPR